MTLKDFFERYGVTLGIVVILAIVVAVLPGNAPDDVVSELGGPGGEGVGESGELGGVGGEAGGVGGSGGGVGSGSTGSGGTSASGGAGAPGSSIGGTGGVGKAVFGQGDCRSDGREDGFSVYQPPCVKFTGSNGGATARGVTADKVVVVKWMGQVDPAIQAILRANKLADEPEVRRKSYEALRRYLNHHTITYGREVVFREMAAGGPGDDDRAMTADAVKIAEDIKAFAVIEGTPDALIPKKLATELARRGVVCMCTSGYSSGFYQENPPYIFGTGLPTGTDYAVNIGEFVGKRLANKNAQWAGDPTYRAKKRKFGLLYVEGVQDRVDPEGKRVANSVKAELAKYGVPLAASIGFTVDPGRNQQDATTFVSKYIQAGVTTLIMLTDPLSPIAFTREMTKQGWFPEHFIAGTGLSDTTTAGRLYDTAQWKNAFGMSPLWITWATVSKSGGRRAFTHGMPESNVSEAGVLIDIYSALCGAVFLGIQMAGPVLTRDTFAKGMFSYPPTGGKPAAPLIYFTRNAPTAVKDFTEVWFDLDRPGNDERGDPGTGMMVKVSNGKRYKPGQWPRTNPKAFIQDGQDATVSDDPKLSGNYDHDADGHTHAGPCKSCPGGKKNPG